MREVYKNKELEGCTFKPVINEHPQRHQNPQERLDFMYKAGQQNMLNRKDRERNEVELERQGKECLFVPQIDQ